MAQRKPSSPGRGEAAAPPRAESTPLVRILAEDGTLVPGATPPALDRPELLRLYRGMVRTRLLEQKLFGMQRQGRIMFYAIGTGEEASNIGAPFALGPADWFLPGHRHGGAMLMRGMPLEAYLGQLYGNSFDRQKGRHMPVHFSYKPANIVTWSSPVGTQLPHAVGAAMAAKIKGDPVVVMAGLGDGATSTPDFHVAMNFAGVFWAPVVFVCNNNQYAISVPLQTQTRAETLAVKAIAYGFPGVRVDGNDILAVLAAAREAVERARAGGGPTFIECVTYRVGPHSSADDPTRYRSAAEVEAWRARDPIARFRTYLAGEGIWTDADEAKLHEELTREIEEAIRVVEAAGPPSLETLFTDVYHDLPWHLEEQFDALLKRKGLSRTDLKGLAPGFP
jgi:pyruvate dehydrogenase E1 component alpha subunit/2-oxoisovalerate dehydrogenase E1 component alpha subunit